MYGGPDKLQKSTNIEGSLSYLVQTVTTTVTGIETKVSKSTSKMLDASRIKNFMFQKVFFDDIKILIKHFSYNALQIFLQEKDDHETVR